MEEYRLRVFEFRVLRKMFGHERDEVPRHWIKLRVEEFHDLC
jgi:hypothetical protein